MDLMREYEDNHFDLAIVDPPYGINVNVSMGRRKGDAKSDYHKFAGGDTCAPEPEYFNELFRVSKEQIVWGANHFISRMPIDSPCWIAWDKGFSEDVTFATFELAWTSMKSTCKKYAEHRKVGVDVARALYGVKSRMNVGMAMLATTSHFTKGVHELKASSYDLALRDYEGILEWINTYKPNPDGRLYIKDNRLVTPGDPEWRAP